MPLLAFGIASALVLLSLRLLIQPRVTRVYSRSSGRARLVWGLASATVETVLALAFAAVVTVTIVVGIAVVAAATLGDDRSRALEALIHWSGSLSQIAEWMGIGTLLLASIASLTLYGVALQSVVAAYRAYGVLAQRNELVDERAGWMGKEPSEETRSRIQELSSAIDAADLRLRDLDVMISRGGGATSSKIGRLISTVVGGSALIRVQKAPALLGVASTILFMFSLITLHARPAIGAVAVAAIEVEFQLLRERATPKEIGFLPSQPEGASSIDLDAAARIIVAQLEADLDSIERTYGADPLFDVSRRRTQFPHYPTPDPTPPETPFPFGSRRPGNGPLPPGPPDDGPLFRATRDALSAQVSRDPKLGSALDYLRGPAGVGPSGSFAEGVLSAGLTGSSVESLMSEVTGNKLLGKFFSDLIGNATKPALRDVVEGYVASKLSEASIRYQEHVTGYLDSRLVVIGPRDCPRTAARMAELEAQGRRPLRLATEDELTKFWARGKGLPSTALGPVVMESGRWANRAEQPGRAQLERYRDMGSPCVGTL